MTSEIKKVIDDNSADGKSTAFILESSASPYLGSRTVLKLGNDIDSFVTRRIPSADENDDIEELFPGVEAVPAVAFRQKCTNELCNYG